MSDFLNRMKSAAKADLKTIVLPEGEDPRTIVAANKIIEEGLAKLVILGNPDEIDVPGATVIDPRNAEKHEEYAQKFAELRAKKGVTIEQARAQVMDATYFGTMMVKMATPTAWSPAPATPPPTPCAPHCRFSRPLRAPSWSRPSS